MISSCCDVSEQDRFGASRYADEDRGSLPDDAVLASLGCGNPTAVADLHEGETVLDLADGLHGAIVRAAKPMGAPATAELHTATVRRGGC